MNPRYCDLCGFTQEEFETVFADEIDLAVQKREMTRPDYFQKMRRFYNA